MIQLIVSDEITLKQLAETDAPYIFRVIDSQREYLGRWLPFVPGTKTVLDTMAFIWSVTETPEFFRELVFCIHYRNEFAGLIGLKFNPADKANKRTEIGYWLSEPFQKKGIVTQAAKMLIDYAFDELELNRIAIKCAVGNQPSKNIPMRLGFIFEGIERDGELFPDGHFVDLEVFSLLKKEWK